MSTFDERFRKAVDDGILGYEEFDDINKYAASIIKLEALHVWHMLMPVCPGKEGIIYNKAHLKKAEKYFEERQKAKKEASDESDN